MTDTDPLSSEGFDQIQRATLEKAITVYPARSWAPSQVGHPCDRFLVYRFTRWEEQKPHDWTLQSVFAEGNLHAPDVYRRLEDCGFMLVRESDRPQQWVVKGAKISGRTDGRLIGYNGEKFAEPLTLEIKSMAHHTWVRIETYEDIKHADAHYVRGYADQMQLYLLLDSLQRGVFALKSKSTGLIKLIVCDIDMERGEWLLQRIQRLDEVVKAGADVAPIDYDDGICGRCPFNHVCWPAKSMGEGLQLIEDQPQLLEDLQRELELKPKASEYEAIKKSNRKTLARLGDFEAAALGNLLITVKKRDVKGFSVAARTDTIYTIREAEPKVVAAAQREIEG